MTEEKKYNEKGSYLYRSELSTGATMNFIIKRWQCIMMKRELSQHILARTKLKSRKIKLWAIWLSNFMFQKNDEGINKRDRFYAHGQLIFAVGHRICMLDGWWFLFSSSPSLLFLCSWFLFPSYYRKIALKKIYVQREKNNVKERNERRKIYSQLPMCETQFPCHMYVYFNIVLKPFSLSHKVRECASLRHEQ